jgi:hypothetical protein
METDEEKIAIDKNTETPLTPAEIFGWLEFGCWTMVALWPFLYWVNGPAVSTDQFVVRTALIVLSLAGGITLGGLRWRRRRSQRSKN